jgi:hypothetical protein
MLSKRARTLIAESKQPGEHAPAALDLFPACGETIFCPGNATRAAGKRFFVRETPPGPRGNDFLSGKRRPGRGETIFCPGNATRTAGKRFFVRETPPGCRGIEFLSGTRRPGRGETIFCPGNATRAAGKRFFLSGTRLYNPTLFQQFSFVRLEQNPLLCSIYTR